MYNLNALPKCVKQRRTLKLQIGALTQFEKSQGIHFGGKPSVGSNIYLGNFANLPG